MLKGYISLHVLDSVCPSDLGLTDDCSKEEFEIALTKWAEICRNTINNGCFLSVNDIETEIIKEE